MQTFFIIIGVIMVLGILYYQGTADVKAYQASRDLIVVKEKLDTIQRQLDKLKRELEEIKQKQ
jgi:predicted negative regulator of RcsB-dependent stress response